MRKVFVFDIDGTLADPGERLKYITVMEGSLVEFVEDIACTDVKKGETGVVVAISDTAVHVERQDGSEAKVAHKHVKSVQEWDKFLAGVINDEPIEEICEIARMVGDNPAFQRVYCTGRSMNTAADTIAWLEKHGLWNDDPLYMRAENDFRPDVICKNELFDEMVNDGFMPDCVFEDRAGVVEVLRQRGLRVCQVARGDF